MFDLRNKLIIQDLIRELEDNKLSYQVIVDKTLKNGEVIFLSIRIEGKEND